MTGSSRYSEYVRARNGDLVTTGSFPHSPGNLYLIEIGLTYSCQCRCAQCAISGQPKRGKLLTADEIADLCRQAREDLGAQAVQLFGGEPLVRKDIVKIVEGCARHLEVVVSTNGISFTGTLAARLKKAGLKMVVFSLDSTDPATNDRIRGRKEAFKAVMRGLDICKDLGIRAHLSSCVTPAMIRNGEVARLIEFARNSKAEKLCILPAKIMGRFAGRNDVLFNSRETYLLWDMIEKERGGVYVETESNTSKNIVKCFVLRDWMYISPYGTVQPCVYVSMNFGNVRRHSLKFLYKRMFEHPVFKRKEILNLCLCQNPEFIKRHLGAVDANTRLVTMFDD